MSLADLSKKYGVSEDYMQIMTRKAEHPADFGAAQALRNAGWSLKDISDYLKIPEEELATKTKPPKLKKQYENEWNAEVPFMKHNELI